MNGAEEGLLVSATETWMPGYPANLVTDAAEAVMSGAGSTFFTNGMLPGFGNPAELTPAAFIFSDTDIDWRASISAASGRFVSVVIVVMAAGSVERAKRAASELADVLALGRTVHWRREPEAEEQTDFLTGEKLVRGYARFTIEVPEKGFGT